MTAAAAPVLVTGTGTDVGKTIATAALAALARSTGLDVGICKPVQTGLAPGEPGDADEAARLSRVQRVLEVRRLPDPLAPETAARVAGVPQTTLDDLLGPIRRWLGGADAGSSEASASAEEPATPTGRLDLIEGAGGVLVRLGTDLTVLDLSRSLAAPVVVVAAPDVLGIEKPVACVVPEPGQPVDADELIEWCRQELAAFKRPRAVVFVDEIAKTATGKVRRNLLRERVSGVFKGSASRA